MTIKNNISALFVTYGSMIFEGAIITLLIALMKPLSLRYNVSTADISVLLTAQGLGTVATVYFSGNASDKIGKKTMILLGLMFYFVFLIGMIFTTNFYLALFLSLLAGIGHGFMDSPSISMLIDIFGDHSGPAMSVVAVFFSGGGAISALIVSRLLAFNLDFRIIFIVYIIIAAIVAIVVSTAKYPKKQIRVVEEVSHETKHSSNKILWRTASFLALITFLFSVGNTVLRTWISTYGFEVQGLALETSLNLLTYLQIGNVLGAFFFAYILTKIHSTKVMIANGIIATIALSLYLSLDGNAVVLIMITGAVLSIGFSLSLNIIGELFIENSGQATGFIGTALMSASMTTTFVSGRLLALVGVKNLMWMAVGIIILAGVLAGVFRIVFVKVRREVIDLQLN